MKRDEYRCPHRQPIRPRPNCYLASKSARTPQRPRVSRLTGVIALILDKALEYVDAYVRPAQPECRAPSAPRPRNVWLRSGRTPGTERGEWPGRRWHPPERAVRVGSPRPSRAAAGRGYLDGCTGKR